LRAAPAAWLFRVSRLAFRSGASVPLGDVADLRIGPAPNVIRHETGSRRIDVNCNVSGRDPGSVVREIEHPMAAVILGGLITSTLLNLFLMPSLFYRFAKNRNRESK
jgi:Cu/Ag efflux pump CusA